MWTPTPEEIIDQAKKELAEEAHRKAVDEAKLKIKTSRRHWFPWRLKITLERRGAKT